MKLTKEQKIILIVLTLINFFNYVDRQLIFPLFASIKQEFGVSDFQLGLLGTLFMLVHSLASVPLGILADRYSRKTLIAVGVGFWSAVTFFSGLVTSFKQLVMLRSLVGIGEASYAPAATAIISDTFPAGFRARAQGIYNIGMFTGGTLGAMLAGTLIFYFHSWRAVFFIVAVPGLILAYAATRLKVLVSNPERVQTRHTVSQLWKNPAYIWILISGVFVTFAAGAFISWGIEYIHRYKDYNLRDASLILGSSLLLAGILGVLLGSYIADKAYGKFIWGRAGVIAFSLILATPLVILGMQSGKRIEFFAYFFPGAMLLCFYNAPITAVIHDIVPQNIRATAYAIYLLIIHLLGDTLSPAVIGAISDQANLKVGLEVSALFILAGGVAFLPVCYYIAKHKTRIYHDSGENPV